MTLPKAIEIAASYGLNCDHDSNDSHTLFFHFLNHGFTISKFRSDATSKFIALDCLTVKTFRKLCTKHKPKIKSPEAKAFYEIASNITKYVKRSTIGIPGIIWYPQFNLLTITSDGFPQARFVVSQDFKSVFFAHSKNPKLEYAANPDAIPHMFPTTELKKWLGRITT